MPHRIDRCAVAGEHAGGAGEVLRQLHDPLTVLVGEHLAHRCLRARLTPVDRGSHRAQPDEPQHLGLDVQRGEPLSHPGVVDSSFGTDLVEQVARRWSASPERASARERDALVRQGHLRERPSPVEVAHEVRRGQAHVGEEDLVEERGACHLLDRPDLDAGRVHRADEVRDAAVLRDVGVGARDEDAELRHLGARRPDLLAVDDELVAVTHCPGRERGEIAAGSGLAEQLAPDLLAREQREEVPILLLVAARVQDRRAGPSDPDLVLRPRHLRSAHLVVDHELEDRARVEPPRARPVGHDVSGLGELSAGRLGVGCEPLPHLESLAERRRQAGRSPRGETVSAPSPPPLRFARLLLASLGNRRFAATRRRRRWRRHRPDRDVRFRARRAVPS